MNISSGKASGLVLAAVSTCAPSSRNRLTVAAPEGHSYKGTDAIRQWKADASTKYSYTAEPFSMATDGDRIVVTSHLEGDFPGSPVDLRYFFRLEGDKVADLEIIL